MAEATTVTRRTYHVVPVRRVVALMNAGAGAFNQKLASNVEGELASTFAHNGIAARILFVDGSDLHAAAESALAQAKRGAIDAVVVGGGDGSIRTVASALAGTDVPLGVLPLGTLNHFAKDLGVPLNADAAVSVIAAGHVRAVDLAEVNG
ncbi:MAG: diacylglycerol/lipid kinase family protein, partial [Actinomycetota bacterium]